jgi:hypothetical protein
MELGTDGSIACCFPMLLCAIAMAMYFYFRGRQVE